MAKNIKKLIAMILSVCMAMSLMTTVAFAEDETTEAPQTIWRAEGVTIDVEERKDGYTHQLFGADYPNYIYYETSNHALQVTNAGAVHLFALVDARVHNGEFSPSGIYEHGESNYEVVYCCDVTTLPVYDNTYYKRVNPEESEYLSDDQAEQLRAILTHAYPYFSVEETKAWLKDAGFDAEMADKLDRSELISATQSAIWAVANADSNDSFYYRTTAMTGRKLNNWGGYLHEYHPEITNFNDSMTSKKYYVYPEIGARIDALRDFLLELDPVESEEIVISNLEIVESFPVMAKEGVYTVALQVELNDSGSSKKDDIAITVFVDGEEAKTVDVKRGTEVYDLTVEAQAGQTIEAVVSGIQILPEDVYFYEPEGGRETSQCLIGVAEGETSVYSQAEVTLEIEESEPVTADLQLQKTSMSGKKLSGAEFELFVVGEEATISIGTFEVDEDGMLSVEDLLPGSYELEEITAPDGYVELDDNIEFEITEEGKFEMSKHKLASFKKGTLVVKNKAEKPTVTPSNPDIEIPDEDVPLTEIPDEEVPLAEIPELFGDDHYAYVIGYPDGMVHPEGKITRAEVATIFFRLLDEEIRAALMTDVNNFSDVAKGQWYNHAVSTLSSIGVILGRDNGSFDPNAFITRAEFAAIAARFDPTGNPEGVFFTDIAGHWAEREIIIAANNGWVEGYNGLFRPDDYITRAEAMTLVNRVLHRLPETEHDLLEYMVIWPDNMDVNAWYYLAVQEATNSHDYNRKPNPVFETWTEFMEPYDWSLLEY